MEYSLLYLSLLIAVGFVAGIINTLAGGGSNLSLPTLMMTGMPADVANATNRVAVFLQSLVGIKTYQKYDKLDTKNIIPILIPSLLGGVLGSILVVFLPVSLLKPLLLIAMVGLALLMLISPQAIYSPEGSEALDVNKSLAGWLGLFFAGVYGGFVQAGVGFILIAVLAGSLQYDLVKANALKLVCTLIFTSVALSVFIWNDLVLWLPGLVLAIGNMIGAFIAVKISLNISQKTLKWFLFIMTVVVCIAAILS